MVRKPRWLVSTLAVVWLSVTQVWAAPATEPLELGVFPYLSTRAVLELYAPLQRHLESRLRRPVLLVTARDMETFLRRTQEGRYPVVITAPHFARLAEVDAGYVPLLRAMRDLSGVLVVTEDSEISAVNQLRGQPVAVPAATAIITMLGKELLREHGLVPGSDVFLVPTNSHNSAVLSVQRGDSAAALTSATALEQMPAELRTGVRTLAVTAEVPHVMYLAHPGLDQALAAQVLRAIRDFPESSEAGARFVARTGHVGFRPPSEAERRRLDPFVAELRDLLEEAR